MHIVYFLLSLGAFLLAIFINLSTGAAVVLIILALAFLAAGAFSLINARLGGQQRSDSHIISPEELRQLREQAEKIKQQKSNPTP